MGHYGHQGGLSGIQPHNTDKNSQPKGLQKSGGSGIDSPKFGMFGPHEPKQQTGNQASQATAKAAKALSELTMLQVRHKEDQDITQAFGNMQQASDAYTKVNTLPETDTTTFQIAV